MIELERSVRVAAAMRVIGSALVSDMHEGRVYTVAASESQIFRILDLEHGLFLLELGKRLHHLPRLFVLLVDGLASLHDAGLQHFTLHLA